MLGFLPALVAGALVLLAAQPDDGGFGAGWADAVGLGGLADDLDELVPAIAFALGLVFGLTFDTTGRRPRRRSTCEGARRLSRRRRAIRPASGATSTRRAASRSRNHRRARARRRERAT